VAADATAKVRWGGRREWDDAAETLVIAFGVVVGDEFTDDAAQMTLAEGDDVPEAFVLDRANKPFGVGVQIRAVRGQAQQLHPGCLEERAEVRGVERVPVDDQVAEAPQRARRGIREIAGDLLSWLLVRPRQDRSGIRGAQDLKSRESS
jgi:hypothetical protein